MAAEGNRRGSLMGTIMRRRLVALSCVSGLLLVASGCGESSDASRTGSSESTRAAALSLQQAMDGTSRAVDDTRSTPDSIERLGASLQPAIAQTSDVIGLLTPKATSAGADGMLLEAAREQRSFLQFAADATHSRSRKAASSSLARSRDAGRRASVGYSKIAQHQSVLAGSLPASTTFNTGRLRDALVRVHGRLTKTSATARWTSTPSSGATGSSASACGDGLSVNSATSCPFARAVRDAYEQSAGASVIDVYSPVTKQDYTMSCSGAMPTVCSGGNGAVVSIR